MSRQSESAKLDAVSAIRQTSEGNVELSAELDNVIETLLRQTEVLQNEVSAFKV